MNLSNSKGHSALTSVGVDAIIARFVRPRSAFRRGKRVSGKHINHQEHGGSPYFSR
jgi:hypothetical protein